MIKKTFKKNLLTTASAFAIGAFASQGAMAAAGGPLVAGTDGVTVTDNNYIMGGASVDLVGNITATDTTTVPGVTLNAGSTGVWTLSGNATVLGGQANDAGNDSVTIAANSAAAINLTASTTKISSAGGNAAAYAIDVANNLTGALGITNAGTISTTANGVTVINITGSKTLSLINNSGTITADGAGKAIVTGASAVFTAGIRNSGTISSAAAGAGTIDLSAGLVTFTAGGLSNLAGTITSGTTGAGSSAIKAAALTSAAVGSTSATTTDATNGVIYNTGTIQSTGATTGGAVWLSGLITNTGSTYNATTGVGAGLYNAGVIKDTAAGTAIFLDTAPAGTTITNASGGTISTLTGSGIEVTAAVTGQILNLGSITSAGGLGAVTVSHDVTLLTNDGTIEDTIGGDAIEITNTAGTGIATLNNTGLIQTASGIAIDINRVSTMAINNGTSSDSTATIQATGAGTAISVDAAVTGTITNYGTIAANGAITIDDNAGINGEIANFGSITSTGAFEAIEIAAVDTDITNGSSTNATATISSAGNEATIQYTGGSNSDLVNWGIIKNTGTGAAEAIEIVGGSLTGGIDNKAGALITVAGTAGAITATGDIDITTNITNAGTISSTNATPVAIDIDQSAADGIIITNSGTIIGAIKLGDDSDIVNSGTINGNITALAGGNTVNTLAWNGGTITGTIDFDGDDGDAITVGDAASDSISTGGAITNVSTVTVNNGTFGVGHNISLVHSTEASEIFKVASGATGNVTTDVTLHGGTVDIDGKLTIAAGKTLTQTVTTAATDDFAGTSTLNIGMTSTSAGGFGVFDADADADNAVNISSGMTLDIDVTSSAYIANNSTMTGVILAGSTGELTVDSTQYTDATIDAALTSAITITDDSYALLFAVADSSTDERLDLTVTRQNTYQSASTLVNESAVGTALEAIANTGDSGLTAINAALDGLSSAAAVETALKTLTPDMSGAVTSAANSAASEISSVVGNRLDQLAGVSGDSASGVATGGMAYDSGLWGQAFGSAFDQSERDGVRGYQGETAGFAIGADTKFDDQGTIGVSIAYAQTDADSANGTSEIDSIQGNIYGTYDYGKWYSEGLVAFTHNSFDTTRNVTVGSIANRASASFDGQQYTARFGGGYKLDVEGGLNVTPVAAVQYDYITIDKYTETGSTANLAVDNDDLHILKTDIGVKLNYPIVEGSVTYIPEINAGWQYDLIGDEQSSTNNFTGAAGTLFTTKGADVAQHAFVLGTGLDILAQDNVTISFDYDWTSKEDYNAHSGSVKARFAF